MKFFIKKNAHPILFLNIYRNHIYLQKSYIISEYFIYSHLKFLNISYILNNNFARQNCTRRHQAPAACAMAQPVSQPAAGPRHQSSQCSRPKQTFSLSTNLPRPTHNIYIFFNSFQNYYLFCYRRVSNLLVLISIIISLKSHNCK